MCNRWRDHTTPLMRPTAADADIVASRPSDEFFPWRGESLMQSNLRVGVLGVGYWGSKHLRVLQSVPGVTEVHAIDERLGQMPEYAQFISAGRGHLSLTAAMPHVDAVVIATPPTSHARLGLEAI